VVIKLDLNFLNGIYYVKTKDLLTEDDFNALRRLDSNLFLRYLKTKSYGFSSDYKTIENVISKEMVNTKDELNKTSDDNLLSDIFYMDHDITNIKIVFKEVYYNIEATYFDNLGRFSKQALEQLFKYGNMKLLPKEYNEMYEKLLSVNTLDLKEALQLIEKIVYDFYTKLAKNHKSYRVLHKYLEYKKVITNLKTFLKFKYHKEDILKLKKALLNEEIIGEAEWIDLYNKFDNEIINKLYLYFNSDIVLASAEFLSTGNITDLRKETRNYLDDTLRQASFEAETIAPVLYYLHLKEKEAYKVRELYYGK